MSKVLRNQSGKKRGLHEEVVTILEVGVLEINIFLVIWYGNTKGRVFITCRHRRLENSPATTQNSPAKFHSLPERALLFHNNSLLLYTILLLLQFLIKSLTGQLQNNSTLNPNIACEAQIKVKVRQK